MPQSPKLSRAPSRVPQTPPTPILPRAPKRLAATPTRPQQKAKRLPETTQPSTRAMTPIRAPLSTPRSARRKQPGRASTIRSPKRTCSVDPARGVVKKRIVEELATKRALSTATPVASIKRSKPGTGKSTKDKGNPLSKTRSAKTFDEAKKRKLPQSHPETDKKPAKDRWGADIVGSRARTIYKSHQPKVNFASSITANPSAEDKNMKTNDYAPQRKESAANSDSKPTRAKASERDHSKQQGGDSISKSKKKRPTAGRFDLCLPDLDGKGKTSMTSSKKLARLGQEQAALSPRIMINEAMSESKLQLLESSPLNRLISAKDRKAAAAEVATQKIAAARKKGKSSNGLNSKDLFVPLDRSASDTTREDCVEEAKLEAARKKEARRVKWKARQIRKRGELLDSDREEQSNRVGVVYLGHIPHGFYEKEMRSYFSQFGEVTRLRLCRSKKTGRSRGFAFLEFADAAVASIAAEAMDGYLMHGQALVAKVVPEEKVHPDTFEGADRTFRKVPWSSIERRKMIARAKDPLKLATRSRRVKKVRREKLRSLSRKGIKYDFPELTS